MSVYVDEPDKPYGRMVMCHMIADSHEELMDMVGCMSLRRNWIQDEGTYREHFDICKSNRALAIAFGAIELSNRELYQKVRRKRELAKLRSTERVTSR